MCSGISLKPLILGGGQEFGLRSGTESVAAAAGLAKALDIAQQSRVPETRRLQALRDLFISELKKQVPLAVTNGSAKHRTPHIINLTLPAYDNERLMIQLDEAGIQAAVGSACSAAGTEPSHVLKAIGLSDEEARSSLRFSLGRPTTREQILKTVKTLADLTGSNR